MALTDCALYELRTHHGTRVFWVYGPEMSVVLFHGYHKQSQDIPRRESARALAAPRVVCCNVRARARTLPEQLGLTPEEFARESGLGVTIPCYKDLERVMTEMETETKRDDGKIILKVRIGDTRAVKLTVHCSPRGQKHFPCMTLLQTLPLCFTALVLAVSRLSAAEPQEPTLKTEHFDHDPDWEGYNNHMTAAKASIMKQDFGYSPATNFAGKAKGEIGGAIQRASKPASYGAALTPAKSLEEKLSASGSFAVTGVHGGGGLFFGFFNAKQPGGSGRPIGSLGLDFDYEAHGARLAVRLISNDNKSCGTFITPYLPGKFRPTPIKIDGTRYDWTLDYDPQGAEGTGRFTFTIGSGTHKTQDYGTLPEASEKEARARFPFTTTFTVDVPADLRKEGATFDRFGIHNMMKSGGAATIFFDDVQFNGRTEDFSKDPAWVGAGNRETYENTEIAGVQNFGYQPTDLAGGSPGEIGGLIWRSPYAYYADRVGPFTLRDRLKARGRVILAVGAPDSGMMLGWFNSEVKKTDDKDPLSDRNFIGVSIGGPTRVGHYFLPICVTKTGRRAVPKSGPVLKQGQTYEWTLVYDPETNNGHGQVRVTIGSESSILDLRAGQKPDAAMFDRFGLFGVGTGGSQVKIYFDDLTYSAAKP